jgi:flagellar hook assembly protein FlgD
MSKRTFLTGLCLAIAWLTAATSPSRAQLVTRFEVTQSVVSPDGDGRQDSTRVRWALADTAEVVEIIVFEADSVTPVLTLRAASPDVPDGIQSVTWKGQNTGGSYAGDGVYIARLRARRPASPDTLISLPVFLDTTPPSVQILSVIPNPYAPGAPGPVAANISYTVGNASPAAPGRIPDALGVVVANSLGAAMPDSTLITTPPFAGASGTYVTAWNGTGAPSLVDGEYTATVTLIDAAGYTVNTNYHFEVDSRAPTLEASDPTDRSRVSFIPDDITGFAYDKRGIDSLYVRFPNSGYLPVTNTTLSNDTLRFAVSVVDSISEEDTYNFVFRAVDSVGRATRIAYRFTYDVTAPTAPVLDDAPPAWHTDRYPVSGTVDNGGDASAVVLLYGEGALVDSVATSLLTDGRFTREVPVAFGSNVIHAIQRDGGGNLSPASNRIVVRFEDDAGVFVPAPFYPGSAFQVNGSREAERVTLRVFDVAGDMVKRIVDDSPGTYYNIVWDGRNESNKGVRRGPLVVVLTVDYADGGRNVHRQTFLFDPEGP